MTKRLEDHYWEATDTSVANPLQATVSVIIPTYNRSEWVTRAIDTVYAQHYTNIELMIVDDGSTDDTVATLQAAYPNLTLLTQAHAGVSRARNYGITQATGEWIAFLDSDDAWTPNKLAEQLQALQQQPTYKICHTNEIWYRHGKRVNQMRKHQKYGGWIFQQCLSLCRISPSSVLIHRDVFADVGLFDENLPACEDYDLWLRITARYPVLYLEDALTLKYGGHADQLSHQHWGMDRFRIAAIAKILQYDTLSPEDRAAAIAMLHQKITIYCAGAKKRGKLSDIHNYEKLLQRYPITETT